MTNETNETNETMRPDVQAYLIQAAVSIAESQGFVPADEAAMMEWMRANRVAICEKAKELQWALLEKYTKQEARVKSILSTRVWVQVQRDELRRKEVQAYEAALA